MTEPHVVDANNASTIARWIISNRGLAIWTSVDLSDPGYSPMTPAKQEDGTPMPKPSWKVATEPARTITDVSEVMVQTTEVVKRFHVAVRMGGNGLVLKCTDGATRRINREVSKAGAGASYSFDYSCQDVLIHKPVKTVPLAEYLRSQP